jgi:hypothetical protein
MVVNSISYRAAAGADNPEKRSAGGRSGWAAEKKVNRLLQAA